MKELGVENALSAGKNQVSNAPGWVLNGASRRMKPCFVY
jgi:hypothetical protein